MNEKEIIAAMRLADEAMREAITRIAKLTAQVSQLTSERDIFSSEAERWRALAYKLTQPKSEAPLAP